MKPRIRALLAGLASVASATPAQTFTGFEDVLADGFEWYDIDIADDGRTAVLQGRLDLGGSYDRAIAVWNQDTGFTEIPAPGGIDSQRSISLGALSGDGTTVVFRADAQGYTWNETDGPRPTPLTPTTAPYWARDTSADGSVVVGQVWVAASSQGPSYLQGARWTGDDSIEFLSSPIADVRAPVRPSAVSRNGQWIAGSFSDPGPKRAALWGPDGAFVDLSGALPLTDSSTAYAVSNDGSIAYGGIAEFGRSRAWRWTESQGPQVFDVLSPTHDDMQFVDTTADGSVAVGRSGELGVETVAIVWDETNGTRSFQQMLTDMGVAIGDWQLETIRAISADGSVVAGSGVAPNGDLGVWIVSGLSLATAACAADMNGDGQLSPADFNAWLLAFNTDDPSADQNGDGRITPADFGAWILNFNTGC